MRKKHDEGYALVFVLVVVLVLSGIAIALMTGALRNLQAQNAAIERMQDKYVAEGMIEVAMITVKTELSKYNPGMTVTDSDMFQKEFKPAISGTVESYLQRAKAKIPDLGKNNKMLGWTVEWASTESQAENHDLLVKIDASYGSAYIDCCLLLSDIIKYSSTKWDYAQPSISYTEYQISYNGGGA
jgi:type II secretory pathway pseudopilin PulG